MKIFILGYQLAGSIEKQIWELKEALYAQSADHSWIFFGSLVVVNSSKSCFTEPLGFQLMESPLVPEMFFLGKDRIMYLQFSLNGKTTLQQADYSLPWLQMPCPAIPFGKIPSLEDSHKYTDAIPRALQDSLQIPESISSGFYPSKLVCQEWEISETPFEYRKARTLKEYPVRKVVV